MKDCKLFSPVCSQVVITTLHIGAWNSFVTADCLGANSSQNMMIVTKYHTMPFIMHAGTKCNDFHKRQTVGYFKWVKIKCDMPTVCGNYTSPWLVRKMTSPWLFLRWRCPSGRGSKTGVATSNGAELSALRPKARDANSPCGNAMNGEWRHIGPLNSSSFTGTPEVAIAQHGFMASDIPAGTTLSAPCPPTACTMIWFRLDLFNCKDKLHIIEKVPSFVRFTPACGFLVLSLVFA